MPSGNGASVSLIDTSSVPASATTNAAGNFWVLASIWAPAFPVHVVSVSWGDTSNSMTTHIGRDGSCADCHSDPPGHDLVGRVYLAPGAQPAGGFPDGGP